MAKLYICTISFFFLVWFAKCFCLRHLADAAAAAFASAFQAIYLSIYIRIYLSFYLSIDLSVFALIRWRQTTKAKIGNWILIDYMTRMAMMKTINGGAHESVANLIAVNSWV